MAVPISSVPRDALASSAGPAPVPTVPAPASAATPIETAMQMTSFDRIVATSSSTTFRKTPRAAGHIVAAKARGVIATRR
jgi:hypothetical protein